MCNGTKPILCVPFLEQTTCWAELRWCATLYTNTTTAAPISIACTKEQHGKHHYCYNVVVAAMVSLLIPIIRLISVPHCSSWAQGKGVGRFGGHNIQLSLVCAAAAPMIAHFLAIKHKLQHGTFYAGFNILGSPAILTQWIVNSYTTAKRKILQPRSLHKYNFD